MGMYENLTRLLRCDQGREPDNEQLLELMRFCVKLADALERGTTEGEHKQYATGLSMGFALALGYVTEFGIPDIGKNLFIMEPA